MLYKKCGQPPINKVLHHKSLVYAGVTTAAYSAYLGILYHRHHFGFMWDDMFKTDLRRYLLRFVVLAGLAAPFGILFLIVPWSLEHIWTVVIFKTIMPCFACGYVVFAFSNYFFNKFDLLNHKNQSLLEMIKN